jgi:hypothetical protein
MMPRDRKFIPAEIPCTGPNSSAKRLRKILVVACLSVSIATGNLINGAIGNLGYDRNMPYILEHLTSLRQEITDLRNMNAQSAARTTDSQIDQSAVEMRANRLVEIKKELSQMLNRPEDPRVWWEKGGRRNRVA